MKKFVTVIWGIVMIMLLFALPACNKGAVQSWTDYEDGDQIQVKIDGITYLVHSSNIALEMR